MENRNRIAFIGNIETVFPQNPAYVLPTGRCVEKEILWIARHDAMDFLQELDILREEENVNASLYV